MSIDKFDLIVIGAGPGGQKAALQGAKLRKRVAVIERERTVGGACVTTGTLPSKTLRETVAYLSGLKSRNIGDVADVRISSRILMSQLMDRKTQVIRHETDIIVDQLRRNNISVYRGFGSVSGANTVHVDTSTGLEADLEADNIVIATGSKPAKPRGIDFVHPKFLNSDTLLELEEVPHSLTVLGGGVIGSEYACVFGHLGSSVNLVDRKERLLTFLDNEVIDALSYHMRNQGITLRQGESVDDISELDDGRLETRLKSGKVIRSDYVLSAMGRTSNVEGMGLSEVGVDMNDYGLVTVNESYQTTVPNIYAVGDVIGFPSLASTSMEQGRLAACHALGEKTVGFPRAFPYGLYTIPEISFAGKTEAELTHEGVPYDIGKAEYRESARAQIMGYQEGFIKLLFHRETMELLGVHIIGESATELVHIGQAVIHHGGKLTYFIDNVLNYPTLAECYKMAALNGINRQ